VGWDSLFQWEWLLIELLVLGLLVWQWVSVNREIRRDREARQAGSRENDQLP
jgi:hypothetical protein